MKRIADLRKEKEGNIMGKIGVQNSQRKQEKKVYGKRKWYMNNKEAVVKKNCIR